MNKLISELVNYGLQNGLVHADDKIYVINQLLELFGKAEFQWVDAEPRQVQEILDEMNDYAAQNGLIEEDTITNRDLFDTKIMGLLTPPPSVIRRIFKDAYAEDPKKATDYYYAFSKATNYIRTDRVKKDQKWPPVQVIAEWAARKGLPTNNTTIYLICRSIWEKGIKARPFINASFEEIDREFEVWADKLFNALCNGLDAFFNE